MIFEHWQQIEIALTCMGFVRNIPTWRSQEKFNKKLLLYFGLGLGLVYEPT